MLDTLFRILDLSSKNSKHECIGKVCMFINDNYEQILQVSRQQPIARNVILVDLGNMHDTLRQIEHYKLADIYIFADKHYNGYGVNKVNVNSNISLIKTTTEFKNSADIHIIWKVFELMQAAETSLYIHIATKDKGFLELTNIVESKGHFIRFHPSTKSLLSALQTSPS